MVKSARARMIVLLAIGGVLGYAAASSRFNVFRNADAGPSQQRVPEAAAGPALHASITSPLAGVPRATVEQASHSVNAAAGTCCAQGSVKGRLGPRQ